MVLCRLYHGIRIPNVERGHAAASLSFRNHDVDPVFLQNLNGGFSNIRGLVIHHATWKQYDLALCWMGNGIARAFSPPLRETFLRKKEHVSVAVKSHDFLNQPAEPRRRERPIAERGGHSPKFSNQLCLDQETIPPRSAVFLDPLFFPGCHETWKIDFVLMRWRIGAMVKTELAVITLFFHLFVIGSRDLRDITVVFIDPVQKGIK